MSNLISETDILLSHGQILTTDSAEPSTIPSEESDACSLYDTRALASKTAEHGFCYYAKNTASIESARGPASTVDMASEMLASRMASGKLAGQATGTSEIKSSLFDVIQSIVPPKSYTMLKGAAFYEYLSSLRSISRSEASRLSQGNNNPRKRRRRADRHYLSTGRLMLSPEEISSLGQINTHRENSSQ